MDGPNGHGDHSDSDSSDSWTLLDNTPCYAEEPPHIADSPTSIQREETQSIEVDEDTDGISVISDSDHESSVQFEHVSPNEASAVETYIVTENKDPPTEININQYLSENPQLVNNQEEQQESLSSDDAYLLNSSVKHRTYVHKRNKRASTVLNLIVLGSVITAAGVAIGHMWGVKDDCIVQSSPTVNKILSNLYKLQEENAILRNKIKDLTAMKFANSKKNEIPKKHRCKKLFEESLNTENVDRLTKCVDDVDITTEKANNDFAIPQFEKEFISDIDKLKNVYEQNKSWLDVEIAKRQKDEQLAVKRLRRGFKIKPTDNKGDNISKVLDDSDSLIKSTVDDNSFEKVEMPITIMTYAESVKIHKDDINDRNQIEVEPKHANLKRKRFEANLDTDSEMSSEEEHHKKDDRYQPSHKSKSTNQKHDRQKNNRKQKRRNKYQQWELKSGYMRDYDDVSMTSLEEGHTTSDKGTGTDKYFEEINEFNIRFVKKGKKKGYNEDTWYNKRVTSRAEQRKRLAQELFGDNITNTAGWYFKRLRSREKCRNKGDDGPNKRNKKNNMNFKVKI